MKMNNIFLIGFCLLIAGIGILAVKANTESLFFYYYQATPGLPFTCQAVLLSTDPVCDTIAGTHCNVIINTTIGSRPLFLRKDSNTDTCRTPLTKE